MNIRDCKVGDKVHFGRANGEKTLGEVIKMNPTKAKVRTLEERGRGRSSGRVGVIWSVPYSMMTPAGPKAVENAKTLPSSKLDIDVTVGEGKYRVIFGRDTTLQALRYGEEWRKLDGDNLVLALAQEVQDLRAKVVELENAALT
jgi:hypothetical protein